MARHSVRLYTVQSLMKKAKGRLHLMPTDVAFNKLERAIDAAREFEDAHGVGAGPGRHTKREDIEYPAQKKLNRSGEVFYEQAEKALLSAKRSG